MRKQESMTSKVAKRTERGAVRSAIAVAIAIALGWASAMAVPAIALAQANGASAAGASKAPRAPSMPLPDTISPTITGSSRESAPPAPAHHSRRHRKTPHETPNWVTQSNAQLALQADPRFKNVHATITQPGVLVLEGEVFDNAAKLAAAQTASGVHGVKQVINALKTNSLKWLLQQNRINQALQQNGFAMVSAKVIGQTAFLSGQVSSAADRDRAVAVVKSAGPDLNIGTNLIEVKASMF